MSYRFKGLVDAVLDKALGIRIVRTSALQRLTVDIDALKNDRNRLQQEHDALRIQHSQLLESERVQRARADWLKDLFQKSVWRQHGLLSDFVAQVCRMQSPHGPADGTAVPKKMIVVVLTSTSQITQLSALAHSKRLRQKYDLTVVGFADVNRAEIVDLCDRTGITLLSHDFKVIVGTLEFVAEIEDTGSDYVGMLASSDYADAEKASMRDIATLVTEMKYQRSLWRRARSFLIQTNASMLAVFEDNAEYVTGIWIDAARELSIASVILPYTIADELEPAEAHHNNEGYWADIGIHNRLAKAIAPHWLFLYRNRWLLRRNGASALAAETLGVAPPMPWILNSSKADVIAVESEAMRRHYVAQGIPEAQLAMTGSVTDDVLLQADQQRDLLKEELGLDARPILLCSFPPNQLTTARPECQFANFHMLVDSWLGALRSEEWQVLVKPHPSMRAEDIDYLRQPGVRVITEYETTSLIPLCDLYNPSVSSTIRWALACGKPVLNYDVYGYRYQDFVSEPAVLTVFDAKEFSDALKRLTGDSAALRRYSEHAKAAAPRWAMMDGRSMERIVGLFDKLTANRVTSASLSS
jgi:hypothetical protein